MFKFHFCTVNFLLIQFEKSKNSRIPFFSFCKIFYDFLVDIICFLLILSGKFSLLYYIDFGQLYHKFLSKKVNDNSQCIFLPWSFVGACSFLTNC